MSDCGVCLSEAEDGIVDIIREDDASKSRKDRRCEECRALIPAGTPHQLHVGAFDGEINEYRTCTLCVEIRNAFSCNGGFVYGQLWKDLEYAFDDGINDACFLKLQTVEAKKFLRSRWMKWRGLVG
jgi:hypothetical protein